MSDWFKNPSSEISDEMWRTSTPIQRQADAAVLWAELTGKHASGCGSHGPSKPKKKKISEKTASRPKRVNRRPTFISAGGPDVEGNVRDRRMTDKDLEVIVSATDRDLRMNPLKHVARGSLIMTAPAALVGGPAFRRPGALIAGTALGTGQSYLLPVVRRIQAKGEIDRRKSRGAVRDRLAASKAKTAAAPRPQDIGKVRLAFKAAGQALKNPGNIVRAISRNPELAGAAMASPASAVAAYREFKPGKNGISRAESNVLGQIAAAKAMGADEKKVGALKKKLSRAKYLRENYSAVVSGSTVVGGLSGAALGRGLRKLKRSE